MSVVHTDAERKFNRLLELLGEVAELPGRFLCAELTMNAVAIEHSDVHESLDRNAEFWALASNALHTSVFVTLHRLFDDASAGNVYAVLNCARSNPEMFLVQLWRLGEVVPQTKLPSGPMRSTRQPSTISSGSIPKSASAARSAIECIGRFEERSSHIVCSSTLTSPSAMPPHTSMSC
jgi:hypothetical protein